MAREFHDELDDHIRESMKDPDYRRAVMIHRLAQWKVTVPVTFLGRTNVKRRKIGREAATLMVDDMLAAIRNGDVS